MINILSKDVSIGNICKNHKALIDVITPFTDAHDEYVILDALQVLMLFHVPLREGPWSQNYGPYVFQANTKVKHDVFQRWLAPVLGSVSHKKLDQQRNCSLTRLA